MRGTSIFFGRIYGTQARRWLKIGSTLLLTGVAISFVSFWAPWYVDNIRAENLNYPHCPFGHPCGPGVVEYSNISLGLLEGYGQGVGLPTDDLYESVLPNTGNLYHTAFAMTEVGSLAGTLAGAFGVARLYRRPRDAPQATWVPHGLAFASAALILMAPISILAFQQSAAATDMGCPSSPLSGTFLFCTLGPAHSFSGGANFSSSGWDYSAAWGPCLGWYLAIVAGILVAFGATFVLVGRRWGEPHLTEFM